MSESATALADRSACAELIAAWGIFRDQGRWQELRATFAPDGHIAVSWFRGPFAVFVEHCRASHEAGLGWSRHHLYAPAITLGGDRAMAQTSVIIRVRQPFDGLLVDLTSYARFVDRLERHRGGWLIAERAAVYERDRLDPVEPSPVFEQWLRSANAGQYPEQFRYMALRLAHAPGRSLAPLVYRDGGPETAELYARFAGWLAGKTP